MAVPSNQGAEIRVIKRAAKHAAHHGGAWKVAYADFVTAMMAFFLVMWVTGMSQDMKSAIEGYFKDPEGFMKQVKAGNALFKITNTQAGSISNRTSPSYEDNQHHILDGAKERIVKSVGAIKEFKELSKSIDVKVTSEGLKIDLLETRESLFFKPARAELTPTARHLLAVIARQLESLPNKVAFEGHTDNRPLTRRPGYTNWELSTDRANAARQVMENGGLAASRIAQVRGYAATQPRDPIHPDHFSNRRVSILVMFNKVIPADDSMQADKAEKSRTIGAVPAPAGPSFIK